MNRKQRLIIFLASTLFLFACGAMKRAAVKYWTKKQVNSFVADCEEKATKIMGEKEAKRYCDCAVDIVAQEYQDYESVKKLSIREIIRVAKDCKSPE